MSWSSRRALALSDLRDVGPGLVEVDVEVGVLLGRREDIEVLQGGADLGRAARPVAPLAERLARRPPGGATGGTSRPRTVHPRSATRRAPRPRTRSWPGASWPSRRTGSPSG